MLDDDGHIGVRDVARERAYAKLFRHVLLRERISRQQVRFREDASAVPHLRNAAVARDQRSSRDLRGAYQRLDYAPCARSAPFVPSLGDRFGHRLELDSSLSRASRGSHCGKARSRCVVVQGAVKENSRCACSPKVETDLIFDIREMADVLIADDNVDVADVLSQGHRELK
jgi:hypothetical protein